MSRKPRSVPLLVDDAVKQLRAHRRAVMPNDLRRAMQLDESDWAPVLAELLANAKVAHLDDGSVKYKVAAAAPAEAAH
jgi:hypothetical protein